MVSLFGYDLKSESGKFEFEFACIKCNLSFKMTKELKAKVAIRWLLKQTDLPVAHSANTPVQQLVNCNIFLTDLKSTKNGILLLE